MPKQFNWEKSNFVSKIMKALLINNNSRSGVIKILNDCACAAENNVKYDPKSCYANVGRKAEIKEHDYTPQVIYDAIETGMSYTEVTTIVNCARKKRNMDIISTSAIKRFIASSEVFHKNIWVF